ncbi:MAG: bifunctional folylpolyglutamate synthase/dihydrofolate synthase [Ruminococcus sp.]|nr:bifunctional folylpolyglutamate synthase/dihydrofolate synthase [Ruminococcus sp.]
MKYLNTLERIHSLNKFGSRPGLDRIKLLLDKMGNPQNSLRFLHVAGTNGKGSVCAVASSVLKASGYKTGLFISPYITDFCERIQINNEPIPHEKLSEIADYVFSLTDELNKKDIIITEFEFVMAVAFEYFKREKCDIVVLEVGLGGRLDSTNVIKPPLCAAITRIGLDHTDILGDTEELIAKEKCGIIKESTRVVSSPQSEDAKKVIEETCKTFGNSLIFSDALSMGITSESIDGTSFVYKYREITLPLLGEHQVQNLKTALCALEELKNAGLDKITPDTIKQGVERAVNPARFEVISKAPYLIIDGAHNPDGMSTFASAVKNYLKNEDGVLIIGMLSDKDSRSSLKYIEGLFEDVYTVPINNPRAMTSIQMANLCKEYFANVTPCENVEKALTEALKKAKEKNTHICVCGSLYLAGEIRPYAIEYTK